MRPSEVLADRYHLQLSQRWRDWFDCAADQVQPRGALRHCVSVDLLKAEAPEAIWAGFMLPDTLPIVGNEYGDWICVRVEANGCLGELVYWYHGGGDWIPVGDRLAEALLHDAIDLFRPDYHQPLRGAGESLAELARPQTADLQCETWRNWLIDQLSDASRSGAQVRAAISTIHDQLADGKHEHAVALLQEFGWAKFAAACDLIEYCLRNPVRALAQPSVAERCGIVWYPDFVEMLFDVDLVPRDMRQQLSHAAGLDTHAWPRQDWERACRIATAVLSQRDDLGWAFAIAGWGQERQREFRQAVDIYHRGRLATSFSDQSVRLGYHATTESLCKFTIAQLQGLRKYMREDQAADWYLQTYFRPHRRSLLHEVSQAWQERAARQFAEGRFAEAYDSFYRAGWDLGVSRLGEYAPILEAMVASAERAGSDARAEVARTHLRRLIGQSRPSSGA
ncbi:MAG: hypothetical protein D6753_14070 [Planctomycetota bacterium]|nr:MAG: hypothetical protein D6753_14070 [Planctomycetota bacterium]